MDFYTLRSIVAAQKKAIPMQRCTESFCVAPKRGEPYIEPAFVKTLFEEERPAVILVSAVGATGKTTLAQVLSNQTGLPMLDLAKHKAVGDNTLTGLLHGAFGLDDLKSVFEGIGHGTFGVIIDGIDEGRSKTNKGAFEAFLDDIAALCRSASATSFVLLGRTIILDECWDYLTDQGVTPGLITIAPFDLDQARIYIDSFTGGLRSNYAAQYCEVRNMILETLAAAFKNSDRETDQSFLSFIGYPPVLDAIVTLLQREPNYHRLSGELRGSDINDIEIQLLHRIASYILRREKDQKVVPHLVLPLIEERPQEDIQGIIERVFEAEEQCMRLVAHCLGRPLSLRPIGEPLIDEKYEDQLPVFLREHPFVAERRFRNAVFEAVALGTLILSSNEDAVRIALEYADAVGRKHNYHLVYLLHRMAQGRKVPISALGLIIASALEFRSRRAGVEIDVEGPDAEDLDAAAEQPRPVEIRIEVIMGSEGGQSSSFVFRSDVERADSVRLGHRLSSTYVSLPCEVSVSSDQELEFTAPVEISAARITLRSPALLLRPPSLAGQEKHVLLDAATLESNVGTILTHGVDLVFAVGDRTGLRYPAIQYVEDRVAFPRDPQLKEKYLRLRKILVQFRSHSRGGLAKYRDKVEHERVLRNEMGWAILRRCLDDGIITVEDPLYFLQPGAVDKHLGVSWHDLRRGHTSPKLEQYLRSID